MRSCFSLLKRLSVVVLVVCALAQSGTAQGVCNRHVEKEGGFSFCVPAGWSVVERPEHKYKIVFAPRSAVFTANINLRDELNNATLDKYVAASLKLILSNYKETGATSVKVLSQSNFSTASGLRAIKLTLLTEYKGLQIRTQQYYFSGNYKLIVTCTALEEESAALAPVFDGVMKSFQAIK